MAVNIWDRQHDETEKAYEAFEIYRDLGEERALAKVSAALGHKSSTGIERWSAKYQWRKRVVAYDNSIRNVAMDSYKSSIEMFVGAIIRNEAKDYHNMLHQWREIASTVTTPNEFAKMMQAYDTIDRIGRRIARLPTSFNPETEIPQSEQEEYILSFKDPPMRITKTAEIPSSIQSTDRDRSREELGDDDV
jgi:hypothetical protein